MIGRTSSKLIFSWLYLKLPQFKHLASLVIGGAAYKYIFLDHILTYDWCSFLKEGLLHEEFCQNLPQMYLSFLMCEMCNLLLNISYLIFGNFLNKLYREGYFEMSNRDIYAQNQTQTFLHFSNLPRNLVPRFLTFFGLWI